MHVYIFTCELDCFGIGIHAFHMHWNTLGLHEGRDESRENGSKGCLKIIIIGG